MKHKVLLFLILSSLSGCMLVNVYPLWYHKNLGEKTSGIIHEFKPDGMGGYQIHYFYKHDTIEYQGKGPNVSSDDNLIIGERFQVQYHPLKHEKSLLLIEKPEFLEEEIEETDTVPATVKKVYRPSIFTNRDQKKFVRISYIYDVEDSTYCKIQKAYKVAWREEWPLKKLKDKTYKVVYWKFYPQRSIIFPELYELDSLE
ncbi:MAG: hypothetical protein ACK4ND_02710 [Cytophagaceae bacterium]